MTSRHLADLRQIKEGEYRSAVVRLGGWVVAVSVLLIITVVSSGVAKLAAAILLVICVSIPQLVRLRSDPLDAPALYIASSAFLFGVMSLYWFGSPESPPPGVDRDDVSLGLVVVAIGLLFFTVGALTAGPPRTTQTKAANEAICSSGVLICLFCIGLAATLVGLITETAGYAAGLSGESGVSASGEPIILLSWLAPITLLCAVVIRLHRPERISRSLVASFAVAQITVGVLAGFKGQAILPIEYLLLAYLGTARRIPWRGVAAAGLVLCLVIAPIVNGMRAQQREGYGIRAAATRTVTDFSSLRPDHAFRQSEGYFSIRLRHADQIALITQETPNVYPFAGGATYSPALVLQAVPRALWPGKPVLDQSSQYAHTYWQIPEEYQTATPLTQLGDLYRNFGLIGLCVGALLIGGALGLYQRAASRRRTLRFEVMHIFVLGSFVVFMKIETELPVLIGAVVKTLPIALSTAVLVFPLPLRGLRNVLRRHRVAVMASAAVTLVALAFAAYDGPFARPSVQQPGTGDVLTAFRANGGRCRHPVLKPANSPALWNLNHAYECRIENEPVLVLIFDSERATQQISGVGGVKRPGLAKVGNVVALYDAKHRSPRAIERLRVALRAAIRAAHAGTA